MLESMMVPVNSLAVVSNTLWASMVGAVGTVPAAIVVGAAVVGAVVAVRYVWRKAVNWFKNRNNTNTNAQPVPS